ncbi:MAG TPA: hypothetical protein PKE26_17020 [Kiritimatiellia bacterium]|nr:hypothetical protein [Kiritimatiellia bacterium]
MVSYDRTVIQTFADFLYQRAASIIAIYTIIGVILGGIFGRVIMGAGGMILLAMLAGFAGYLAGNQRAIAYKLQAQMALCQVQIEINTRRSSNAVDTSAS